MAICLQTLPFVNSEENLRDSKPKDPSDILPTTSVIDTPCRKKLSISASASDVKVKCLAVLEPVERLKADCTVDEKVS